MLRNQIYPVLQSSFRAGHGTETALLKVMNDIMLAMDSKCVTPLVLLDLIVKRLTLSIMRSTSIGCKTKSDYRGQFWIGSNHICLIEVSGYLSVEHFLHALTWIAAFRKALVWDRYCSFHSSQLFDVLEKHLLYHVSIALLMTFNFIKF